MTDRSLSFRGMTDGPSGTGASTVSGDAPRFEPITSRTLVDTVVEQLRDSILSGRFAPGERLVEAELARELAISRGPIREALALLEKDGIVVNVPRRGKFLPAFDAQTIDEIYSLRKVLEPYAVQLLIATLTETKVASLHESLDRLRDAADAGDVRTVAQRDIDFHNSLYVLSGHDLLRKVWAEAISGQAPDAAQRDGADAPAADDGRQPPRDRRRDRGEGRPPGPQAHHRSHRRRPAAREVRARARGRRDRLDVDPDPLGGGPGDRLEQAVEARRVAERRAE